jgi:hypothetical protein
MCDRDKRRSNKRRLFLSAKRKKPGNIDNFSWNRKKKNAETIITVNVESENLCEQDENVIVGKQQL